MVKVLEVPNAWQHTTFPTINKREISIQHDSGHLKTLQFSKER